MSTIISQLGEHSLSANGSDRFFIPMVPPYVQPEILSAILPFTAWIGLNFFEIKHSRYYLAAKSKGVKDTFHIDGPTKVFVSTIASDQRLKEFYSRPNWFNELKSDLEDFNADLMMGPDWFSYRDDSPEQRTKDIQTAKELNLKFADLENVIPTIRGNYCYEVKRFIEPFKTIGKDWFAYTGREYLVNRGDRKQSEFNLLSITSNTVRKEKIRLIVTGCSSPRQQSYLSAVSGFTGLGWLIRARERMLISKGRYDWLFDDNFSCNDADCCLSLSRDELSDPQHAANRAIHNLKRVNEDLRIIEKQPCLEDFNGF